jgi:hypothetical protein
MAPVFHPGQSMRMFLNIFAASDQVFKTRHRGFEHLLNSPEGFAKRSTSGRR